MKRKMMIRGALLGALSLLTCGCLGNMAGSSHYETTVIVHYEPDYTVDIDDFLATFFDGGKDTVSVTKYLSLGPLCHHTTVGKDSSLVGGFAMCIGVDSLAAPDRKLSRLAVFDKGGKDGTLAYAVFHDTLSTLMPEHAITFDIPNENSSCSPLSVYVQNVQAVVQASRYGTGLADGPFGLNDHLTLTVKGFLNGKALGSKSLKLVDGTHILEGWTEVDLSSFGDADALDFSLESNRPDLPLYCCLDDLMFHFVETY